MSILEDLQKDEVWDYFLENLDYSVIDQEEAVITESIIRGRKYRGVVSKICKKEYTFPIPNKYQIPKKTNRKKTRDVYTFKFTGHYTDHIVLRVITMLLSRYSDMFSPNLYSSKDADGVRGAVNSVTSIKDIESKLFYKTDISDYGNSVDVDILLPILRKNIKPEDWDTIDLIYAILRNDKVKLISKGNKGEIITDNHRGVMTGMPFAPFLSNVFLTKMDAYFYKSNVNYYRFIDDILIVANADDMQGNVDTLHKFVTEHNLSINPDKEFIYRPDEKFIFLGIQIRGRSSAVSTESISSHKKKIRKYADECRRMVETGQMSRYEAFVVMIGKHNNYLYGNNRSKYCFSNMYFQMINTSENLCILDKYAQECIRYVYTGKFRNSNRIKVPYEWLRDAGYIPLVSAYRIYKSGKMPRSDMLYTEISSNQGNDRVLRSRSDSS